MIDVKQFQRKPAAGFQSIERLFFDVRANLPEDIKVEQHISRFPSKGIWPRLYNIIAASLQQGSVNHITGDVHFLSYLFCRKKTILTILDCVMMERLVGIKRQIFWFFWLWLPAKRSEMITVISEATRQQVISYLNFEPEKVRVIYCNVSDEFQPSPQVFNKVCPKVLQVGTSSNKNIDRIAEAFQGLSCILVIVGHLTDEQKKILSTYKIQYENMVELSREELLNEYICCDLLVFVSTYEGFGLPIIEANAVGRPVITSNIWSMPEVAGNAACLVDPYNVFEIRQGVLRIINDDNYRKSLIDNGYKNVERFQSQTVANQYADVYREIYISSTRK